MPSAREQLEKKYGKPKQTTATTSMREQLLNKYGANTSLNTTMPKEQGFLSNVKNDLLNRAKSLKDTWVDSYKGKINPLETGIQTVGSVAGGIGDVIGEGITSVAKTAWDATPSSVKSSVKGIGEDILKSDIGKQGLKYASMGVNEYSKWKANNPQTAKDIESVFNVASLFPIGKGAGAATKGAEMAAKSVGTVAKGTGKAIENTGKFVTAQSSGLGMKTIETIIKNPKALTEAEKAGLDSVSLGSKVKKAIDSRVSDLKSTGKAYEGIRRSNEKVFLEPGKIGEILGEYGIGVSETASKNTPGKVNYKLMLNEESVPLKTGDIKELENFLNTYGKANNLSGNAFMNARSALSNLKSISIGSDKSDVSKVIATRLRQYYDSAGKTQLTGLEKLDSIYGPEKAALSKIKKEYLTADGELKDGALSRIANATNDGREPVLKRLESLVPGISEDINLYRAIKDIEAVKSQKVGAYAASAMRSGLGGFAVSGGNPIVAITGMIMSAPQVVIPMLKNYGKLKNVSEKAVDNLINKMKSGKSLIDKEKAFINKSIVSAADKFNNSKTVSSLKNIKPGLTIEDVSDPLLKEAKKVESVLKDFKPTTSMTKTPKEIQAEKDAYWKEWLPQNESKHMKDTEFVVRKGGEAEMRKTMNLYKNKGYELVKTKEVPKGMEGFAKEEWSIINKQKTNDIDSLHKAFNADFEKKLLSSEKIYKNAAEFIDEKLPITRRTVTAMDKGVPRVYSKQVGGEWTEGITGAKITNPEMVKQLDAAGEKNHEPVSKMVKELFSDDEYAFRRNANLSGPEKEIFKKLQDEGYAELVTIDNPYSKGGEKWEVWRLKDDIKNIGK